MDYEAARRTAAHDRLVIAHGNLSAAQADPDRCPPRPGTIIKREFFVAHAAWIAAGHEYSNAMADYAELLVAAT